jgi:hypothetical protein
MTPKEKAEELIKRFNKVEIFLDIEPSNIETNLKNVDCDANKQCALIAVDEILHSLEYNTWQNKEILKYYEEVKQEIEKIDKL